MNSEPSAQLIKHILTIKASYDGEELSLDARKLLRYTEDIDADIKNVLINMQLVGSLYAEAEKDQAFLRIKLDAKRGELDEHGRDVEIVGRPTDERVKNWVNRHPDYVKLRRQYSKAVKQTKRIEILYKALEQKARLLQTKSANRRAEIAHQV